MEPSFDPLRTASLSCGTLVCYAAAMSCEGYLTYGVTYILELPRYVTLSRGSFNCPVITVTLMARRILQLTRYI